jgi:hypothetical protein
LVEKVVGLNPTTGSKKQNMKLLLWTMLFFSLSTLGCSEVKQQTVLLSSFEHVYVTNTYALYDSLTLEPLVHVVEGFDADTSPRTFLFEKTLLDSFTLTTIDELVSEIVPGQWYEVRTCVQAGNNYILEVLESWPDTAKVYSNSKHIF